MRQSRVDAIVDRILEQPCVPSRRRRPVSDLWVWGTAFGWATAMLFAMLWGMKVWA